MDICSTLTALVLLAGTNLEKLESASEKNLERPGKTLVVFNNRPNDTHLTHFTYELWHEKKANLNECHPFSA